MGVSRQGRVATVEGRGGCGRWGGGTKPSDIGSVGVADAHSAPQVEGLVESQGGVERVAPEGVLMVTVNHPLTTRPLTG